MPALIPQPNGRGAIYRGGVPGNKGGGRPPHAIRDNFRALLDGDGTKLLKRVLSGTVPLQEECEKCGHKPKKKLRVEAVVGDGLKSVEILARFGVGTKDELTTISPEVRMRVQQTVALIASRSDWKSDELLTALDPIWGDRS